MENFEKKLRIERKELGNKIEKLFTFLQSGKVIEIDEFQRTILVIQLKAMRTYFQCLNSRLQNL